MKYIFIMIYLIVWFFGICFISNLNLSMELSVFLAFLWGLTSGFIFFNWWFNKYSLKSDKRTEYWVFRREEGSDSPLFDTVIKEFKNKWTAKHYTKRLNKKHKDKLYYFSKVNIG